MELWKPITGFEKYQISNTGKIKNSNGRILSQSYNKKGYAQVNLWKSNKQYSKRIHRLVALHFLDSPTDEQCAWASNTKVGKVQVNHIDGNKLNNHVNNLEWNTGKENVVHSYDVGLNFNIGETSVKSKLTELQVLEIRNTYTEENGRHGIIKELSLLYNVNHRTIGDIINRKTWKHI